MNVSDIERAMREFAEQEVKQSSFDIGCYSQNQLEEAYNAGRKWFSAPFDKWFKKNYGLLIKKAPSLVSLDRG